MIETQRIDKILALADVLHEFDTQATRINFVMLQTI